MTGSRTLAEDVFQEVWMKVIEAIGSYRTERAPFRAWLYRVASNAAVDRLRAETVRRADPLEDAGAEHPQFERLASPSPGPEAQHLARETGRRLAAALEDIDERQRTAVLLRHQQGFTYAEIAEIFGVAEGTAKTLVHRGVVKLRGVLEGPRGD
jgi:RNA polymerase sigma-70 factor (ECF subfamily)